MAGLENPLPSNKKLVMLLGYTKEKASQITQERILEAVDQVLMKAYGEKISRIYKVFYKNSFVWLLETEEGELPELLIVTLSDVQKMFQLKLNMLMAFCIAEEGVTWKGLTAKYASLWTQMQRQPADKEDSIILESREIGISDSFSGEEADFEQMMVPLAEKIRLMQEYLGSGNMEAFTEELEAVLKTLEQAKRHSMYALEIYYSIANVLIGFINKRNIRPRLASKIRLMELFDPGSFATWGQAADYIRSLCSAIEETCVVSRQKTIAGITEKTKSYILSNLGKDLSLAMIGQEMGFNPIYLSRVFKQEEGCSIREYIEDCRMDMAKRMIMNSHMKIYEIAEKCGYQNTAYFIKIFRTHFNMTPQECRDRR